ncbi:hypothetical protein ITP53_48145, partial [Nonomuraea sp. K274]
YQQGEGGINPQVAGKAREKLRKTVRKIQEGRGDSVVSHVADVYRDLMKAQEKGEMDPSGPVSEFMREWPLPGR